MLAPGEEEYILNRAYVPEHIPSLMVGISLGEAFLSEGFVFFAHDPWLIFVGYPLDPPFRQEAAARVLKEVREKIRPLDIWFIGPEIPASLCPSPEERESDDYFRLDLAPFALKSALRRVLQKGGHGISIERSREYSEAHADLTREFLERDQPPPRIRELFLRMPDYVAHSPTSLLLDARDREKRLIAFYVVELAAQNFSTYVVGGYSRKNYVPHASDLLFYDMVNLSKEQGKKYIHLGLGVNEGIRRFKKKWGGVPFLTYKSCKISARPRRPFTWLFGFGNRI